MKTIFYISSKEEEAKYWLNGITVKQFQVLDNILYHPEGNIRKRFVESDTKIIRELSITYV